MTCRYARAAALNSAKRKRLISANPCDGVARPKVERPEMKSLDAAGGLKLLAAFEENPDLGPAITTTIGCGLRRGELLALRWSDIDLDARHLTVQRSMTRDDARTDFKEPKTQRSRRTISLPVFVANRLRRHRAEQARRFRTNRLARPTQETLLFERGGEAWAPNTFGVAFTRALHDATLPHVRLHDLRHSFPRCLRQQALTSRRSRPLLTPPVFYLARFSESEVFQGIRALRTSFHCFSLQLAIRSRSPLWP
jgi:integrase